MERRLYNLFRRTELRKYKKRLTCIVESSPRKSCHQHSHESEDCVVMWKYYKNDRRIAHKSFRPRSGTKEINKNRQILIVDVQKCAK